MTTPSLLRRFAALLLVLAPATVAGAVPAAAAGPNNLCVATLSGSGAGGQPDGSYDVHVETTVDGSIACFAPGSADTFAIAEPPAHGTVYLGVLGGAHDRNFSYRPADGYRGTDQVTFSATRDGAEQRFTLRMEIRDEVRRPPTCWVETPDGTIVETDEVGVVAVRCAKPATGDLTFAVGRAPDHGTVDGPEITTDTSSTRAYYAYSPPDDYTGPVSFLVNVGDGRFTLPVDVRLTVAPAVNDAPECHATGPEPGSEYDGNLERNERLPFALECQDDEDDDLTLSVARAPEHGTLEGPDPQTGVIEYVPAHNFFGGDSARFRVSDGANATELSVSFGVMQYPNTPPECLISPAATVSAGLSTTLRVSCSDPEGDPVSVEVGDAPAHGVLSEVPRGGGTFTYLPDLDYRGTDGFTLIADDGADVSEASFTTTVVKPPPPDTTLLSRPSGTIRMPIFNVTFTGGYRGHAECRLGANPWRECQSPWLVRALEKGPHHLEVRALGVDGAPDPTPARADWVQAGSAPETRIAAGPRSLTASSAATFRIGPPETGATLRCRLDHGTARLCASPWTLRGLKVGSHLLEVFAVDIAGTADPSPATWRWRVLPPAYAPCLSKRGSSRASCERLARALTACDRLHGKRRARCRGLARALSRCERLRSAKSRAACRAHARRRR